MTNTESSLNILYELKPNNPTGRIQGTVISQRRILIGRSESCDFVVNAQGVSGIHAVLEINNDKGVIYDMNSTNGTFVNGEKVVKKEFDMGSTLRFGNVEFTFNPYASEDVPPVLDMLDPGKETLPPIQEDARERTQEGFPLPPNPVLEKTSPKFKQGSIPSPSPKALPKAPPMTEEGKVYVPRVVYPLAADPKADFSEYIYEDIDTLYPIFKYDPSKAAVEVIILFKGTIYSVDYLPDKNGVYSLAGFGTGEKEIDFPYLNKKDKSPLVEIKNGSVLVHKLRGYDVLYLSDKGTEEPKKDSTPESFTLSLRPQDIVRFRQNDLQIFIRSTEAPPEVAPAPLLRRDKDFKKYLMLVFLLLFASLGTLQFFRLDKETEKEVKEERVATILYKKKIFKPKPKPKPQKVITPVKKVELKKKPPQKPKVVKKPTPPKKIVKKVTPKKPIKKVVKPKIVKKKVAPPKKGTPAKAKVNTAKPRKAPGKPSPKKVKRVTRKRPRFAKTTRKSPGRVDTYKAINFKSTVSSLLAKGGSTSGAKAQAAGSGSVSDIVKNLGAGGSSGGVKTAKVSTNVGSLTGAARGKLDASTGAEGLVSKKGIYTAGIPSETIVLGSMDPDIIRKILRDNIPQFRYCYQQELDRAGPQVSGVIDLVFTIGSTGSVAKAGMGARSKLPGPVKRCVLNVLRGIKFPEPLGGGRVEVKQPMNFYPRRG